MKKISKEEIAAFFEKCKTKAKEFLKDENKINEILVNFKQECDKMPGLLKQMKYLPIFASLVYDYCISKSYREIPYGTIVSAVAVLIYLISPIDLIPDGIPGIGYTDDAMLTMLAVKGCKSDLDRYDNWKTQQNNLLTTTATAE